jgi:DNA-binding XRE family transcriptional regulator
MFLDQKVQTAAKKEAKTVLDFWAGNSTRGSTPEERSLEMAPKGIREIRKAARLTQFHLSQLTGISRTRLSFAECGYLTLTLDELQRIETAARSAAIKLGQQLVAGGAE